MHISGERRRRCLSRLAVKKIWEFQRNYWLIHFSWELTWYNLTVCFWHPQTNCLGQEDDWWSKGTFRIGFFLHMFLGHMRFSETWLATAHSRGRGRKIERSERVFTVSTFYLAEFLFLSASNFSGSLAWQSFSQGQIFRPMVLLHCMRKLMSRDLISPVVFFVF